MALSRYEIDARARNLRLLLFDVDGVLTNGTVLIGSDGWEAKAFSIRDGAAIIWAQRAGFSVGLISGRRSDATARRAKELGITIVSQDGPDKFAAYQRVIEAQGLSPNQTSYMGDDLLDLKILEHAGLSASPADAAIEVKTEVHWVSRANGGQGAVREFIELVLRATGRWDAIVSSHRA